MSPHVRRAAALLATVCAAGAAAIAPTAASAAKPSAYNVFYLDSGSYAAVEGGSVNVTISRSATKGKASVRFATSDGSAHSGTDYTPVSTLVNFANGQTTRNVSVPILDDGEATGGPGVRTFGVGLSSPTKGYVFVIPSSATVSIDERPSSTTTLDDLEGDLSGWSATGLWHATDSVGCGSPGYASATHAFYYGDDTSCTYDTGAANSGTLTSPDYTITGNETQLEFAYDLATERGCATYDATLVEVSYDSGTTWSTPAGGSCVSDSDGWSDWVLPIAPTGTTLQVRFTFDTVDDQYNAQLGWLIDDIRVG